MGDYGHFIDSGDFCCEGNLFADLRSLSLNANITPRQHKISEKGERQRKSNINVVKAYHYSGNFTKLYKPLGQSLPSNDDLKSFLVSLSTRISHHKGHTMSP